MNPPTGVKILDLERKEELDLARVEVIDEKLDEFFGITDETEEEKISEEMMVKREELAKAMLEAILEYEKRRRDIVLRYMNKKYPNIESC